MIRPTNTSVLPFFQRRRLWLCFVFSLLFCLRASRRFSVDAFHDCVQSRKRAKTKTFGFQKHLRQKGLPAEALNTSGLCAGGICVGMTNGPHQGGNASYPIAWNGTAGTFLKSYMTVPEYPSGLETKEDFSEITYYIWTDIFFGDESFGRMNQLVPQLILGSALDGSSGPPRYDPEWKDIHERWAFGAHYFFEVWNPSTKTTDSHAAYGKIFPAAPGETLLTTFELSLPSSSSMSASSPAWTLTMSVVGDSTRTSVLTVSEPYMGLGRHWKPKPSKSWLEPNFRNMCINACWELYGASDAGKLPSSGAEYRMMIEQPFPAGTPSVETETTTHGSQSVAASEAHPSKLRTGSRDSHYYGNNDPDLGRIPSLVKTLEGHYYNFTTWERDEGNGVCPSCEVSEVHTERKQEVFVKIDVAGADVFVSETEAT